MTFSISNGKRVLASLALVAAFALLLGLLSGPAAAGGQPGASIAKKCKKKSKAGSAKKKKCKKKKKAGNPSPVVRATLTWTGAGSDDADLDLFVFDASGNRAGNGANTIPTSTLSADRIGPAGTETFTDNAFTGTSKRTLSFGVCYTVGGSVHAPFTITFLTADGVTHTESREPQSSFHYDFPGGAPIPTFCPS